MITFTWNYFIVLAWSYRSWEWIKRATSLLREKTKVLGIYIIYFSWYNFSILNLYMWAITRKQERFTGFLGTFNADSCDASIQGNIEKWMGRRPRQGGRWWGRRRTVRWRWGIWRHVVVWWIPNHIRHHIFKQPLRTYCFQTRFMHVIISCAGARQGTRAGDMCRVLLGLFWCSLGCMGLELGFWNGSFRLLGRWIIMLWLVR